MIDGGVAEGLEIIACHKDTLGDLWGTEHSAIDGVVQG